MSTDAALDPPRAHGAPLCTGRLRVEPEDFIVEEQLGFEPAGQGQHVLLRVRKRDANTQWIARELARACGCRPNDVGYAGLKDRRAVATQWFTVPQSRLSPEDWAGVRSGEYEVLEAHRHSRKLPRGALAGNRFIIRIRGTAIDDESLASRLAAIDARGVPNYFGPQRFGKNGSNLKRLSADVRALAPAERGFVLSAARSLVFNAVLGERVRDGTWERLEPGDLANLDGRASHFRVEAVDEAIAERSARLDIHPTGPLWGRGAPPSGGRVLELEQRVAAELTAACELVVRAGMEQERRGLRLAVRDLRWQRDMDAADSIILEFGLSRGAYATVVLREMFALDADYDESST
ncbi:MAG TPA: tRNA pseudouridine(13) synthase TruD [Steroidobacteraceae bacterium]|jgi:tRNA pseudouridine13 synthase|nr:tRNA pseudouridine(13) synthase TruD [Steroidobacteraceae bacterium]